MGSHNNIDMLNIKADDQRNTSDTFIWTDTLCLTHIHMHRGRVGYTAEGVRVTRSDVSAALHAPSLFLTH